MSFSNPSGDQGDDPLMTEINMTPLVDVMLVSAHYFYYYLASNPPSRESGLAQSQ
jgi:biopolymer transport protein ExbD